MLYYSTRKLMINAWEKIQKGTFIIAEAGKAFIQTQDEQDVAQYLANAKALVDAAADAGADAIKFQTHVVEDEQLDIKVTSPHFKGSDRYAWVSRNARATPLEEFWMPLKAYCEERGILFFSTPMSRGAAQLLNTVGTGLWKIGSGDILDFVMLDYIRCTDKPTILSSGMSTIEEVEDSLAFVQQKGALVSLLHCVSKYPCPPEELNLSTIEFYKEKFSIPIGFSDHSLNIDSAVVAVALGATVIEKHFSLSRNFWGSDHKVSHTPEEFAELVRRIREVGSSPEKKKEALASEFAGLAMGEKGKLLQGDEMAFRLLFRKSLMAGQDIPAGTVIEPHMLYAMRPQEYAGGLPSEEYPRVLGRTTRVALKKYDPIVPEAFH